MTFSKYILTAFFLVAGIFKITAQSANFTASPVEGCDSIKVTFTNTSTNPGTHIMSYSWDFGNGLQSAKTDPDPVWYNQPGIYTVKLIMIETNGTGKYTHELNISVRPHPNAFFFMADTFKLGKLTYIFRSGEVPEPLVDTIKYHYLWTIDPGVADSSRHPHFPGNDGIRDTLIHAFPNKGVYTINLRVNDNSGCIDNFNYKFSVSEKLLQIPNVFTPNNDGKDDYFIVPTDGRTVFSLHIYTSSGMLVYQATSKSIIWDGNTSSGSPAWPGTYFYIIESVSGEPVKRAAGFVVLLR